jgi:hypothetical protein
MSTLGDDRLVITELIAKHGHLVDSGTLDDPRIAARAHRCPTAASSRITRFCSPASSVAVRSA